MHEGLGRRVLLPGSTAGAVVCWEGGAATFAWAVGMGAAGGTAAATAGAVAGCAFGAEGGASSTFALFACGCVTFNLILFVVVDVEGVASFSVSAN